MNELKYFKELSLKVLLDTEIIFRPGIMIKPPSIKTIALFGERQYLEICSYLPKLCDVLLPQRDESYNIIKEIFSHNKETSIGDFFGFLSLFFIDKLDLVNSKMIQLQRGQQYCIVKAEDVPWLLNLIFLISGTYNKENQEDFNPATEQAARIIERIKEARKKKAKSAAEETGRNSFEVIRLLVEMLTIGQGYKISDLGEMNLFQIMSLAARAQEKENYETQLKFSMIPMVDHSKDKKFDHWLANFKYNIGIDEGEAIEEKQLDKKDFGKPLSVKSIDLGRMKSVSNFNSDDFE